MGGAVVLSAQCLAVLCMAKCRRFQLGKGSQEDLAVKGYPQSWWLSSAKTALRRLSLRDQQQNAVCAPGC